jgi:hypothetical protein
MLWPVLVALTLWGAAALIFWGNDRLLALGPRCALGREPRRFLQLGRKPMSRSSRQGAHEIMLVPMIQLTALADSRRLRHAVMVDHVAERRFPDLVAPAWRQVLGGVSGTASSLFSGCFCWGLSLPFWLFPPFWPLIPVAILAWVNQRVLRYDALSEHADAAEMKRIFAQCRARCSCLARDSRSSPTYRCSASSRR